MERKILVAWPVQEKGLFLHFSPSRWQKSWRGSGACEASGAGAEPLLPYKTPSPKMCNLNGENGTRSRL